MSSTLRRLRRAAPAMRSCTRAMFSAMVMKWKDTKLTKLVREISVSFVVKIMHYMIAVGGAGSSGRPAFASGTLIMRKINTAKPISPENQRSPTLICHSW